MKIKESGEILLEKKFDRGNKDMFVDGINSEDGGFILVENSSNDDSLKLGPSITKVGKYNMMIELQNEKTISGRYGSISKSGNGKYALIFDSSISTNQEVWAWLFDSEFKVLWKSKVFDTSFGVSNFQIAHVPSGGFLAVGSDRSQNFNLFISEIDHEGKNVSEILDPEKVSSKYGLASHNGEFFIIYNAYKEIKNRRIAKKVGLLKFIRK